MLRYLCVAKLTRATKLRGDAGFVRTIKSSMEVIFCLPGWPEFGMDTILSDLSENVRLVWAKDIAPIFPGWELESFSPPTAHELKTDFVVDPSRVYVWSEKDLTA